MVVIFENVGDISWEFYLFIYLLIYLFVFPGPVTFSVTRTEKLHIVVVI